MTARTGHFLGSTLIVMVLIASSSAFAQQRPLLTQDPETIGAGRVLIEGGVEHDADVYYPLSGLTGNLWRVPVVGVIVGVGSIAEVQLTGGPYDRLTVTGRQPAPLSSMTTFTGDTTSDVDDIILATKVRVAGETQSRPAFGLRFATRLPNAKHASGLGQDTIDFYATALVGKTFQSIRIVANMGLGIMPDPTRADRQNDVLLYGVSIARAVTGEIELVGEINGRLNTRSGDAPPGTESRGVIRAGARYTRGPARVDAALLLGVTTPDPALGFTVGFTYVFDAFKTP
jgi:hypothetical protein